MVKQKRKVTASKVPQKTALPAYVEEEVQLDSISPERTPQSPATDVTEDESRPSESADQDEDEDEQSNTTSSDDDFGRIPIRSRRRFTADETATLERTYKRTKRPTTEAKQRFARDLRTTVPRIQIWFQNRRAKEKKMSETSNNQATAIEDQESEDNDVSSEEIVSRPPKASTSASSFKVSRSTKTRRPKKSESPPPPGSTSATKKRRKYTQPTSATVPVPDPVFTAGNYQISYPPYNPAFQQMDPANTPNPQMPSDNIMYPFQARRLYYPDFDWPAAQFYRQPFPQQFQRAYSTAEKTYKYVDPRKVSKPDGSGSETIDYSEPSSSRSSRKGKLKQKSTTADPISDQNTDYQEDKPDTGELNSDLYKS